MLFRQCVILATQEGLTVGECLRQRHRYALRGEYDELSEERCYMRGAMTEQLVR